MILFSAPAILGLIYFNLDAHHSTLDLLMVFMRIILNFEVGIIAVILIVMLEVSGEAIWSLPLWGQYILVYSIMLLAILDIVYAIINWFNFYRRETCLDYYNFNGDRDCNMFTIVRYAKRKFNYFYLDSDSYFSLYNLLE